METTDRVQTNVSLRIVLYEGELYRLPRTSSGIRVREGVAWVSFAGRDTIMCRGEELRLQTGRDFAVVSPLSRSGLILEVLTPDRGTRSAARHRQRPARPCEVC
jgi:hypothetical protein